MAVSDIDEMRVRLTGDGAVPPVRKHSGDAGADLFCPKDMDIEPMGRANVMTGVSVELPVGHVGLVCSRSGMLMSGVAVFGAPGVVDSGYRGEIGVALVNMTESVVHVSKGDRIAQLVVVPVRTPSMVVSDTLSESVDGRGESGFGSTGR